MRSIIELGLILLIGNLAAATSWFLGFPVNTGPVNILLAGLIYLYVGRQLWINIRNRPTPGRDKFGMVKFGPILKKAAIAVLAALLITLPPIAFFIFPVLVSNLDYSPIKTLTFNALLLRVLVQIPFFTALSEELLFREYIYNRLSLGQLAGTSSRNIPQIHLLLKSGRSYYYNFSLILFNAAIFTLWHLVVVLRTVLDTSLSGSLWLTTLAYLGGLAAIFGGGLVFAWVRQKTGSFFYAALTHWLNVAGMTLAIWLLQ